MAFSIACYGVHDYEKPFFHELNTYGFELKLISENLTHDNINTAQGTDAVLLRGNSVADRHNLSKLSDWGIRYAFTRTIGFDHIDLKACRDLGIKVARVPNYSPYSVAELAVSLAMELFRHVGSATLAAHKANFVLASSYFSREVHSSVVGLVGAGNIGLAEAEIWKGFGARVLAYDPYPSERARAAVEIVSLEELASMADIISVHAPYIKGVNENLIGKDFLARSKKGAVLVNTARGELVDYEAVLSALKSNTLGGFATDVLSQEGKIFAHQFSSLEELPNPVFAELLELYPRVLLTPHMGSMTEPALKGMIGVSFENFHQALIGATIPNELVYQEK